MLRSATMCERWTRMNAAGSSCFSSVSSAVRTMAAAAGVHDGVHIVCHNVVDILQRDHDVVMRNVEIDDSELAISDVLNADFSARRRNPPAFSVSAD